MIAEHQNGARIGHLRVFADELLEKDRRHRRDVLMTETDIGEYESLIARLYRRHADLRLCGIHHPATRENFLAQGHRPRGGRGRMQDDRALQARHVVVEQAAMLDDPAGDFAFPGGKNGQRDLFTPFHPLEQRKIRRREDAEVLAVLAIDALDALGDDELDPGAHLGVRRLFAR